MLQVAKTPPMGWNSWDCYGASVTEEELLGNAEYMAKYLKPHGWEYVVCDIQWYEPTADGSQYHKFADLCMDEYSRLIPAENRFPSSAGGRGFGPIADKIHAMGLKFGIHIMRGIPRQAVHRNTKIYGTDMTARQVAKSYSICAWNTDMYGVDSAAEGAQEYYNSIFNLYASWGVDFVKVDDICNMKYKPQSPYADKDEIEMIRKAIDQCGRDMVLSLSPGPAVLEEEKHLKAHANMWRMTDDFWDVWDALYAMFERCEKWAPYVGEHHWPDCDMLPLGHIGIRSSEHGFTDRMTHFTREEQKTMMTLWGIFRSPLMMGGEMRDNDDWTLSLLTNEDLLAIHREGRGARQFMREDEIVVWNSRLTDGRDCIALFNLNDEERKVSYAMEQAGVSQRQSAKEIWGQKVQVEEGVISARIPPHGCICLLLS
ncbi:MAG: glycoside hydrolase family 27 protein [Lachnospiraceae bacterium]